MITIVVTHEDDQSDEFDFGPSQPTISIGRRSTNDVCIPNLSVSGRHARITFNKGAAWVEDLNSTNGTYILNRLISRQILNHNDELVIGKTRLRYKNSDNQMATVNGERVEMVDGIKEGKSSNETIDAASAQPMAEISSSDINNYSAPANIGHVSSVAGASAGAAATVSNVASKAASDKISDDGFSSEEIFDSVAEDLSNQQDVSHADFDDNADDLATKAMDDSSNMSLSDKAKLALGRNSDREAINAQEPIDIGAVRKEKEKYKTATIEIKNGAKSGHIIPIDKPVTTLGRPGIQIAAIMRKPDGYFLMHIESNDSVDRPTLNNDFIGDEPMLLHPGDELNVAGISVEFDLAARQVPTSV